MDSVGNLKKSIKKSVAIKKRKDDNHIKSIDNIDITSLKSFLTKYVGDGIELKREHGSYANFIDEAMPGFEKASFPNVLLKSFKAPFGPIVLVYSKRYSLYSENNSNIRLEIYLTINKKSDVLVKVTHGISSLGAFLEPCLYNEDLVKKTIRNAMPRMLRAHYAASYKRK